MNGNCKCHDGTAVAYRVEEFPLLTLSRYSISFFIVKEHHYRLINIFSVTRESIQSLLFTELISDSFPQIHWRYWPEKVPMPLRSLSELAGADIHSFRDYVEGAADYRRQHDSSQRSHRSYPIQAADSGPVTIGREHYGDDDIEYSYEDLVRLDENNIKVGLSKEQLSKIQMSSKKYQNEITLSPGGRETDSNEKSCHVCMENYKNDDMVVRLPCGMNVLKMSVFECVNCIVED